MNKYRNISIFAFLLVCLSCSSPKTEIEEFQSQLWKAKDHLPTSLFDYKLGEQFTNLDTTFVESEWASSKRNVEGISYAKSTASALLEIYVADNIIDHITYEIVGDPITVEPVFVKILQRFYPLFNEDAEYGVKVYEDESTEMRVKYGQTSKTLNGNLVERNGSISILLRPIDPNNGDYML